MAFMAKHNEPRSIQQIRREMESFFDDMAPYTWLRENSKKTRDAWSPSSDISEDENEYLVKMDLPGMDKSDINVSMHDNRLIITGQKKSETVEEKKNFIRRERNEGNFYRSFTLADPVSDDNIKASFRDGVLKITVPKAESIKPRPVIID